MSFAKLFEAIDPLTCKRNVAKNTGRAKISDLYILFEKMQKTLHVHMY
jgi:hypothetical protein